MAQPVNADSASPKDRCSLVEQRRQKTPLVEDCLKLLGRR